MFSKEPSPDLERVRFALKATGVKPEGANPLRSGIHHRGYLPHVKREGASYFVTFRLADSLPNEVLMKFQAERAERLRSLGVAKGDGRGKPVPAATDSKEAIEQDYHRKMERYLDKGVGACHLRRPELAEIVAQAIRFFEGERYLLSGWVVMPNHVHAVVWPMPNHALSEILKSWKGYTAREINKKLKLAGTTFWQPEAFDHWIRDEEEKARICRYVRNNPVKAGLCAVTEEWRWGSAWTGWRNDGEK